MTMEIHELIPEGLWDDESGPSCDLCGGIHGDEHDCQNHDYLNEDGSCSPDCEACKDTQPKTIDLTPVGCQTLEGNERVNRAMRVCDMTTVTVAELATQMVITLEANQSYPSAKFDALKAAVTARQDAYENLLKAVSGR
jgi:hypothetical protein